MISWLEICVDMEKEVEETAETEEGIHDLVRTKTFLMFVLLDVTFGDILSVVWKM